MANCHFRFLLDGMPLVCSVIGFVLVFSRDWLCADMLLVPNLIGGTEAVGMFGALFELATDGQKHGLLVV